MGDLRTVDVVFNGRAAHMLFDTGGGLTMVTPEFARAIGCDPSGRIVGFRMDGERLDLQRCADVEVSVAGRMQRRDVAVFDLARVMPQGLPHVDGVLALDLFEALRVTLASGFSGLRIERSGSWAPRNAQEGRMRLAHESGGAGLSVFVPAASGSGDLWLLLDSGNLAGVRLHPSALQALSPERQAGSREVELVIPGAGRLPVRAEPVDALIYDGALDAEVMKAFDIIMDLGARRIWWRRAAASNPRSGP